MNKAEQKERNISLKKKKEKAKITFTVFPK